MLPSNPAYDGSRQHLEVESSRVPSYFRYGVSTWRNLNCVAGGCTWSTAGPQIAYGPCVQSHNGRDYGSNLGHVFGHGMERGFGPSFGHDVQREFGRNLGQQLFEPTARVPRPPISS